MANNNLIILFSGGGYVISPIDHQHKQSVVRHMLDIDWKLWRSYKYLQKSQSLSVHMLGRLAGLFLYYYY